MPDYPRACSKCGEILERDTFAVDRRYDEDGRKPICRGCDREKARRYYADHREEKLAKLREKRRAAKPQPLSRREERELVLSRGWREV